jgi:hypothetical protein
MPNSLDNKYNVWKNMQLWLAVQLRQLDEQLFVCLSDGTAVCCQPRHFESYLWFRKYS